MDAFLQSLADWPPLLVYSLIFVSCFLENILPPAPSDIFVVMAGFLSHGGGYHPIPIFLTAWAGGIAGAMAVYAAAEVFAGRFTESKLGRALLAGDAMAFLLKQYGRSGSVGLFLTRLLPGFRSVVAPFAGLNRIGFWRFLLPVALASGAWYAGLTWLGARIGDRWDVVVGVIERLNATLGAAAIVAMVLLIGGFVWWRRRPAR